MRVALASASDRRGADRLESAIRAFELEWRGGEPSLQRHWANAGGRESVSVLAGLIKADLTCRFARGLRPKIADYLERYPELVSHSDRVLSLIYEEFCLLEERGERPEPDEFCARYAPWRDSLASQLHYHRMLSEVMGAPAPPPRFPQPGDHFEEFRLESILGQGGAGWVYLARDESLAGRRVALKVSPDRGQEPSILARLDHEHIVPVHSVVFQPETNLRGLCMPYRAGLPLDEVIRRIDPASAPRGASVVRDVLHRHDPAAEGEPASSEGRGTLSAGWKRFPSYGSYPEGVAWIGAILARALAHAHSQGILHRDVKPANVLLTLREGPQLLDFNLAHDPDSSDQAAAALRGGTLPYMAPEQLEAFLNPECWGRVGAAADLYSLGLLLQECLTGQPPRIPDPAAPLPRAIRSLLDLRSSPPTSSRLLNPAIPHALDAILARCLACSPTDRYPDASTMAEDLERFLEHRPLRFTANPSRRERVSNWLHRHGRRLTAALILAAGIGALSYRPLVRHLVPVERRTEFLEAVRLIDGGRGRDAIRRIEGLVSEPTNSPLPFFYSSVALAAGGDLDAASRRFGTMLGLPEGGRLWLVWARHHPIASEQMERLSEALLKGKYKSLARSGFDLVLEHKPGSIRASWGAASISEFYRDFDRANALLSGLIRDLEAGNSAGDEDARWRTYCMRAQLLVTWGEREQRLRSRADPSAPRRFFQLALSDLEHLDRLKWSVGLVEANWARIIRANALIALGTVEREAGRHDAASRAFQAAGEILKTVVSSDREGRHEFERVSQKLDASRRALVTSKRR